ncbi:hypothetical protein A4A49_09643 [Nicotiana attenuata]|uniref:Uncharacterized protein n=1 Tax=Nicotiana attenuata TaxID=49451 RepID=A0A314KVF0_NICAT|nr:hypothetical protein A4A49_09643 [Nicotiana attenuata]
MLRIFSYTGLFLSLLTFCHYFRPIPSFSVSSLFLVLCVCCGCFLVEMARGNGREACTMVVGGRSSESRAVGRCCSSPLEEMAD